MLAYVPSSLLLVVGSAGVQIHPSRAGGPLGSRLLPLFIAIAIHPSVRPSVCRLDRQLKLLASKHLCDVLTKLKDL